MNKKMTNKMTKQLFVAAVAFAAFTACSDNTIAELDPNPVIEPTPSVQTENSAVLTDANGQQLSTVAADMGIYYLNIKTDGGISSISIENALFVTKNGERYYSNTIDSYATGIDNVATKNAKRDIYTIDGRKINDGKLQKGVYIVNGKKYVVK